MHGPNAADYVIAALCLSVAILCLVGVVIAETDWRTIRRRRAIQRQKRAARR